MILFKRKQDLKKSYLIIIKKKTNYTHICNFLESPEPKLRKFAL
jgi:hypothetical protein